ncbi:MAG: hypothetical protein APF76_13930 [Desulfitibacter sp. BRH_c19]|nr:MAG: hypothetical protein APF76_13930 [Desulfitibacter sp. BRH_c19]
MKWIRNKRGQALVELALVLPVFLLLLGGVVETSRVFFTYLTVNHAAREGARLGVVGYDEINIMTKIKDSANGLSEELIEVEVSPINPSRGSHLTVKVSYPVQIYMPVISQIFDNPQWVYGDATMRVE